MEVRLSNNADISRIIEIINQAKLYFKNNGIDQWQDGYPNEETILSDIEVSKSHVLLENDKVIGTMYFSIEDDPTYHYIENGTWLTQTPYSVIHRIVVDENVKGKSTAKQLLDYAIDYSLKNNIDSIRIDTHEDNLSMQRFLAKNNFIKCGIIYLESGAKRLAFEKIIK